MEASICIAAIGREYFFLQVPVYNYNDIVPVFNVQYIYVIVRDSAQPVLFKIYFS